MPLVALNPNPLGEQQGADATPLLLHLSPPPGLPSAIALIRTLLTNKFVTNVSATEETPVSLVLRVETSAPDRLPLDLLSSTEPRFESLIPEEGYLRARLALPPSIDAADTPAEPDTYDPEYLERLAQSAEGFGNSLGETIGVLRSALAALSTSMPDLAALGDSGAAPDSSLSDESSNHESVPPSGDDRPRQPADAPPVSRETRGPDRETATAPHQKLPDTNGHGGAPAPVAVANTQGSETGEDLIVADATSSSGEPSAASSMSQPVNGATLHRNVSTIAVESSGVAGAKETDAGALTTSERAAPIRTDSTPEHHTETCDESAGDSAPAQLPSSDPSDLDEHPPEDGRLAPPEPTKPDRADEPSDAILQSSPGEEPAAGPTPARAPFPEQPAPSGTRGRRGGSILIIGGLLAAAAATTALVAVLVSGAGSDSDRGTPAITPAPVTRTVTGGQSAAPTTTVAASPSVAVNQAPVGSPAANGPLRHNARAGESIEAIAFFYGARVDDLLAINGLPPGTTTVPSDRELVIPWW